jgi:hypothetical protein
MSISKLIFFPVNNKQFFKAEALLNTLIENAFINATSHGENHYLCGDNFLSLITFLGCSPNINLTPIEGETHCFISIIEPSDQLKLLGFTQSINPKCPGCTKRIANWKTADWQLAGKICQCDKCELQTPYAELNWKHECGFSRGGFEVNHIYPHEAVPTDQLLALLKQFSGFEWDYCYANN